MLYIIVVLAAVVLLLGLHLWDTKRNLEQSKTTQEFWYNKWFSEVNDNVKLGQLASYAEGQCVILRENYAALDAGIKDLEENYEMQFLSFKEEIGGLQNSRASYIDDLRTVVAIAVRCRDTCLPTVVKDEEELELVQRLHEELAG